MTRMTSLTKVSKWTLTSETNLRGDLHQLPKPLRRSKQGVSFGVGYTNGVYKNGLDQIRRS